MAPDHCNWRKPEGSNEDPAQPKINNNKEKAKKFFLKGDGEKERGRKREPKKRKRRGNQK